MRKIWRHITKLNFHQLKKVTTLFLWRPHYIIPLSKATKECIAITSKNFGNTHHKNNRANAYRHAFWNMLIAYHTLKMNKNISKTLAWAKTITDWHEEAFINSPLEKAMDLHNNKLGRIWFEEMYKANNIITVADLSERLIKELEFSKEITSVDHLTSYTNNLVYID